MMYLGRGGVNRIRRLVSSDPWARSVALEILGRADALHKVPVIEREFETGRAVMLPTSRALAERVHTLGMAWFLSGQPEHSRRLLDELTAAASFPDWNCEHFLDAAEMMAGVALGRDWLRETMTASQRDVIDQAILEHGLMPALQALREKAFWTTADNNWNIVCCGSAIVAAIALRSVQPQPCREIIELASKAMLCGMSSYLPDGGYAEGPGYWEYATRYAALALAAIEEVDPGNRHLSGLPAFISTWNFGRQLTAPSGHVFDYGDNVLVPIRCPVLGWLAQKSGDVTAADWQRQAPGPRHPFDLIWHAPHASPGPRSEPASVFAKAGIAMLRDPHAASGFFVAVKGGDNSVNHAHLDLGTFVLEAKGERFVSDLGRDDYALPGYFTADRRYSYLRTGTLAHNTIVVEGRNQSVSASATRPILRSEPGFSAVAFSINDPDSPCIIYRAVALSPSSHVAIVDHVSSRRAGDGISADWRIHTKAEVTCRGTEATLRLGVAELTLRLVAPFSASFEKEAVPTPPGEADNSAFTRLLVRFAVPPEGMRMAVIFQLDALGVDHLGPQLQVLHDWLDAMGEDDTGRGAPP
jgi:hypothetical protein